MIKQNTKPKSCPCKLIPWNLSTNTAAEYGDLGAILHRETKQEMSYSSSIKGFDAPEPLHLAAQHGHVAIVAHLLNKGYDANTGFPLGTATDESKDRASTPPLHRCCFSGSLGCIQLLLDHGADIFQKDYSFGDEMTPLHKAVKGGRYRAVALLISFMKRKGLLQRALGYRDKQQRTPLDLAIELDKLGEDEILSLRRWDMIAGGPADFSTCIHLLQDASFASVKMTNDNKHSTNDMTDTKSIVVSSNPMFPNYCDCDNDNDDCNNTLSWEMAFTKAITDSTNAMLQRQNDHVQHNTDMTVNVNDATVFRSNKIETMNHGTSSSDLKPIENRPMSGHSCQICNTKSIVLFRLSGTLVCRSCRNKHRNLK